MSFYKIYFIVLAAIFGFGCKQSSSQQNPSNQLKIEQRAAKSGTHYTIIHKDKYSIDFTTTRPDKNDTSVLLCIPAAYTNLKDLSVDGLTFVNGQMLDKKKLSDGMNGAVKFLNGEIEIYFTHWGKDINDSVMKSVTQQKASFIQQSLLLFQGYVFNLQDTKKFQRRAIVTFTTGTAIVESDESVTLSAFAADLKELGAVSAINTDMGDWDEGWYRSRDKNKVVTIGHSKFRTNKQSNWVVFKK